VTGGTGEAVATGEATLSTGEAGAGSTLAALGLRGGVDRRAHLLALGGEGLHLGLDVLDARLGLRLQGVLEVGERRVDGAAQVLGDLVTGVGQELLGGVDQLLRGVAGLGLLAPLLVLLGV